MSDDRQGRGTKQKLPYVVSPSNMVHLKSDIQNDDGESPDCGQTIGGSWSFIFEEEMMDPEMVAEKYNHLRFCTKCFHHSLSLNRTAREARSP